MWTGSNWAGSIHGQEVALDRKKPKKIRYEQCLPNFCVQFSREAAEIFVCTNIPAHTCTYMSTFALSKYCTFLHPERATTCLYRLSYACMMQDR